MNADKQFVVSHKHTILSRTAFFSSTYISTQNFRFLQWVALVELTLSNSHTCHLVLLMVWNH